MIDAQKDSINLSDNSKYIKSIFRKHCKEDPSCYISLTKAVQMKITSFEIFAHKKHFALYGIVQK